ncbi:hypothetical protein [Phenylobacterium sp.]|uniref:hypothetical protein n=1 Tax=Phenylobacterium sp. TaxID=1871053 RepID=UPI002730D4E3|nr:hypothetical protein [Phenylobacterium sp.]MDP2212841.1 hypothetical protein [Phenylobacterium sp.]
MPCASLFELHVNGAGGEREIVHLYCPDTEIITRLRRLATARRATTIDVQRDGVLLFTLAQSLPLGDDVGYRPRSKLA